MTKILHIITRLDMGGSAQNTMLSCKRLSGKYETILVHGLSYEFRMTDLEKRIIKDSVEEVKALGVKVIALASMVHRIHPVKDLKALLSLTWLIFREKPSSLLTKMLLISYI
jgi:hypothetical protein